MKDAKDRDKIERNAFDKADLEAIDYAIHCVEVVERLPTREELSELCAQAYCTERNKKKVVDSDLLKDIATAIYNRIRGEK